MSAPPATPPIGLAGESTRIGTASHTGTSSVTTAIVPTAMTPVPANSTTAGPHSSKTPGLGTGEELRPSQLLLASDLAARFDKELAFHSTPPAASAAAGNHNNQRVTLGHFTILSAGLVTPIQWSSHANQKAWRATRVAKSTKKLQDAEADIDRLRRTIAEAKATMDLWMEKAREQERCMGEQLTRLNAARTRRQALFRTALSHRAAQYLDARHGQHERTTRKRKSPPE